MATINLKRHMCGTCGVRYASHRLKESVRAYSRLNPPTHCKTCLDDLDDAQAADAEDTRGVRRCVVCFVRQARFAGEDGVASHCKTCKLPAQINVKNRKCDDCGSQTQNAMKALVADTRHRLCLPCATIRDENAQKVVTFSVGSPYCIDCFAAGNVVWAHYGRAGSKPGHCEQHMVDGEVYNPNVKCIGCNGSFATHGVVMRERCINCIWPNDVVATSGTGTKQCTTCKKNPATHGQSPQRRTLCADCATPDALEMAQARCSECNLPWVLTAEGKCIAYCGKPIAERIQSIKRDELAVKSALDVEIAAGRLTPYAHYDVIVPGGEQCGHERPDFIFPLLDALGRPRAYLVLEVDENQHSNEPRECHDARMFNLSQTIGALALDVNGRASPVYWLRFNPGVYYHADGDGWVREANVGRRIKTLLANIVAVVSGVSPVCNEDGAQAAVLYLHYGRKERDKSLAFHGQVRVINLYDD